MSPSSASPIKPLDMPQAVRLAFDELDWGQLAIFARHTPTRRLQMMFDMCDFARGLAIASERNRRPDIDERELNRRIAARIQLSYGA